MVNSYINGRLCICALLLVGGCGQLGTADENAKPNQVWNPKIELALTWPNGTDGPLGKGVYISLLDQYLPPVALDQIKGDYLVVAYRFPESSKGSVSLLINEQKIQNLIITGGNDKYWNLSTRMTIRCPEVPKTVISPPNSIPLDAPIYSVVCVSERGITRVLTSDIDLGDNFPIKISEAGKVFLSEMGIVLSPIH